MHPHAMDAPEYSYGFHACPESAGEPWTPAPGCAVNQCSLRAAPPPKKNHFGPRMTMRGVTGGLQCLWKERQGKKPLPLEWPCQRQHDPASGRGIMLHVVHRALPSTDL
eukprot:355127-Chlamydomonas_euryale.AAC.7